MAKAKKKEKPLYKYTISDMEAKYKIFMNPDIEKRTILRQRVKDNDGYCPSREGRDPLNRCICRQFMERDSEGFCKCRLYFKEARTKKQAEAYKNAELEVNEKKEKELVKQIEAEEKKKAKELDDVQ